MSRRVRYGALTLAVAMAAAVAAACRGDIIATGSVSPADPSTATGATEVDVGFAAPGSILVNGGSTLLSGNGELGFGAINPGAVTIDGVGSGWNANSLYVGMIGPGVVNITTGGTVQTVFGSYIGYNSISTGIVTIDGTGSTWTAAETVEVGSLGKGTLVLSNGGMIAVTGQLIVARENGSAGQIVFGSGGGTINAGALLAAPSQLSGTGTVNSTGLVSDVDLVFDATHPLNPVLNWNDAGQNIAVHLDVSGASGTVTSLGAGFLNSGTLAIRDGVVITSSAGYLGYKGGSAGTGTVSGTGSTWNITEMFAGNSGNGVLNVLAGGKVASSADVYVGFLSGATGTINVDGTGSSLSSFYIFVGRNGQGEINISNGGAVSAAYRLYVGSERTGTGSIHFGPGGGTLSAGVLLASPLQLTGTGTVFASGIVSDIDLLIDASHPINRTFTLNGSSQNVTVHLSGGSDLGAGYSGTGTLTIREGAKVTSAYGWLGYKSGANGIVNIAGTGSTWTVSQQLLGGYSGNSVITLSGGGVLNVTGTAFLGFNTGSSGALTVDGTGSSFIPAGVLNVGYSGKGFLNLRHGGKATVNSSTNIGTNSGSVGVVTVDGPGSTWTGAGMFVGGSGFGTGTLNIANGGLVKTSLTQIMSSSMLAMNVGDGSKLDVGTGIFNNLGTIRLKAAPGAAAGSYSPITAGTFVGSGAVQAVGGVWNATTHMFQVASEVAGTAGNPVTINRFQTQRILITDSTGNDVEAEFLSSAGTASLTFTASALTPSQIFLLGNTMPAGQALLGGWTFTATNYQAGNPTFLSFDVGAGRSLENLAVWHFDGVAWTPFAAGDLSYDGAHADFTVTGFSGYAVTAAVPEPGALGMLVVGWVGT
ncbi:MAG TPA: hypothetical protein VHM90_22910, partial [Phycisphaerae bacterium]|nr:hypothetical protein [Phycisphaerae bacterium]